MFISQIISILSLLITPALSNCILNFNDFTCGNSFESDQTVSFASTASSPSACKNLDYPMTAILPASSCFSDFTNITVYDSRDCEGRSRVARYDTMCLNPGFFIRSFIVEADGTMIG